MNTISLIYSGTINIQLLFICIYGLSRRHFLLTVYTPVTDSNLRLKKRITNDAHPPRTNEICLSSLPFVHLRQPQVPGEEDQKDKKEKKSLERGSTTHSNTAVCPE